MFPSMKLTPIHAKSCSVRKVSTIGGCKLATWNAQLSEKKPAKSRQVCWIYAQWYRPMRRGRLWREWHRRRRTTTPMAHTVISFQEQNRWRNEASWERDKFTHLPTRDGPLCFRCRMINVVGRFGGAITKLVSWLRAVWCCVCRQALLLIMAFLGAQFAGTVIDSHLATNRTSAVTGASISVVEACESEGRDGECHGCCGIS